MSKTDTEIKLAGMQALSQSLDLVEAERFIALIQREKFDYTKWRQSQFTDLSVHEISKQAMLLQKRLEP